MPDETILIVDDSKENRDFIIENVLEPHGYHYLTARDGVEGLQLALKHRPDLILLDLQMPRMDGDQVMRQLKSYEVSIPVILMTAHGSEQILTEFLRLGVRDYVKKPYYAEEMLEAMERALHESRLEREKDELTKRLRQTNRELQRKVYTLNVLYTLGQMITDRADQDVMLKEIVAAVMGVIKCSSASVYVIDDSRTVCRATIGSRGIPLITNTTTPNAFANRVIQTKQPLILTEDKIPANQRARYSWVCAAPLLAGDRVIGALVAYQQSNNAIAMPQDAVTWLTMLATYTAIAIDTSLNVPYIPPQLPIAANAKPRKVFISYSRQDWDSYVKPLHGALQNSGLEVWVDQFVVRGGANWLLEINKALTECACMVLCISPDAVKSRWVTQEYQYFFFNQKPIIPVLCREVSMAEMPIGIIGLHYIHHNDTDLLIENIKERLVL